MVKKNKNKFNFNIAKENTFKGKLFSIFLKIIIGPLIKLFWIKRVNGLNNLPTEKPFIIAANHQSYFDFISLYSILPFQPVFLAAEKFYSSKFWRPIMEYTGQIKVEREAADKSQVMDTALQVLKSGKVLGIFPQGTRSRSGKIEKTYTGVAKIAIKAGVSVVPIGIIGAYRIMPPQAKKPLFKKIIQIHIGEPIDLTKYYDQEHNSKTYREVTNKIVKEIANLSNKEYKSE